MKLSEEIEAGEWDGVMIGAVSSSADDDVRRLTYRIADIESQLSAVPELVEALETGISWMQWWLDEQCCECEGMHTCGRTERLSELEGMKAALAKYKGEKL